MSSALTDQSGGTTDGDGPSGTFFRRSDPSPSETRHPSTGPSDQAGNTSHPGSGSHSDDDEDSESLLQDLPRVRTLADQSGHRPDSTSQSSHGGTLPTSTRWSEAVLPNQSQPGPSHTGPSRTLSATEDSEGTSEVIHAPHQRRRMILNSMDDEEDGHQSVTIDLTQLLPGQSSASVVVTSQLDANRPRRRLVIPAEYDEDTESDGDSDSIVIEVSDTDEVMEVDTDRIEPQGPGSEPSRTTPALVAAHIEATHIDTPAGSISEPGPSRPTPAPEQSQAVAVPDGFVPVVPAESVSGSAARLAQVAPVAGPTQVAPAPSHATPAAGPLHVAPATGSSQVALAAPPSSSRIPTQGTGGDFKSPKRVTTSSCAVPDESDDDSSCIICYEPWTNSGEHRLASLRCGHLFGHCCILKWLKANQKCPQCNAKAKKTDIRIIYAKSLRTVDTSERDRALEELKKEKEVRRKVEIDMAQANLQLRMAMQEMNRLKAQLSAQEDQLRSTSLSKHPSTAGQPTTSTSQQSEAASGPQGQYVLDKTIQISQTGNSRVMGFDQFQSALVVSMPSPNQLFPGFGVKKVSAVDMRCTQYVPIHTAMIRALIFNGRNDGLMLTASVDKTIKMTSLISNAVVQTYKTDAPAWSCAWNSSDVNYIYAGLQNGAILIYDTRQVNQEVHRLALDNSRCPIVSLNYVPRAADQSLGCGGLLMASLGGMSFWEQTSDLDFKPHLLQMDGKCTSLSFHNNSRHCLASFRPNQNYNSTRHVMCELKNERNAATSSNEVACYPVQTFYGGPTMKVLTRSTLYQSPDKPDQLYACSGDEASSSALIWDTANGNQVQKLTVNATVLDVCPFQFNQHSFLAALTEKQVKLYKWQSNR
ncbi:E3 ubiquitin-protein ligase RFWD3-like isoform X2 [Acanthaster planci]|uniref:RING-type E3 ubiquitin transferase n=1 Tax=Acanthaster planci TaxID=133434 RepID=A0A8B7YP50_ACAPL|nr:E3 ubiquitin-protein ligase RFWD3-like isoform X2 [Acanthaster planci]